MAFQDSAGNKFTNRDTMKQSEARLKSKSPAVQADAPDADPTADAQSDPLSSPEAQQCFEAWEQAGVQPEDVANAYAQFLQQSQGSQPAAGDDMGM